MLDIVLFAPRLTIQSLSASNVHCLPPPALCSQATALSPGGTLIELIISLKPLAFIKL